MGFFDKKQSSDSYRYTFAELELKDDGTISAYNYTRDNGKKVRFTEESLFKRHEAGDILDFEEVTVKLKGADIDIISSFTMRVDKDFKRQATTISRKELEA